MCSQQAPKSTQAIVSMPRPVLCTRIAASTVAPMPMHSPAPQLTGLCSPRPSTLIRRLLLGSTAPSPAPDWPVRAMDASERIKQLPACSPSTSSASIPTPRPMATFANTLVSTAADSNAETIVGRSPSYMSINTHKVVSLPYLTTNTNDISFAVPPAHLPFAGSMDSRNLTFDSTSVVRPPDPLTTVTFGTVTDAHGLDILTSSEQTRTIPMVAHSRSAPQCTWMLPRSTHPLLVTCCWGRQRQRHYYYFAREHRCWL